MKKVVALLLSVIFVFALAGCDNAGVGAYKNEVSAAAKKLNDTYTNYIIETTVEFQGTASVHIEVVKGDDIYTEYSIDEDGNMGMLSYGSADTISYAMVDWTNNGQYYAVGSYEDEDTYIKFPSNYATNYANDREMMFVNRLLAGVTKIEPYDDIQMTSTTGVETYKGYKLTVKADVVSKILSYDSWGVYQSVKDSEKSGSNITKLCDFYLEELEPTMACSDGTVIVGIDQNGILKFMTLEVGGLGTRLYITKVVVDVTNQNVRETPDFSKSVPLTATMTEMAELLAPYKTHDEMVKALNAMYEDQYNDYLAGLLEGGVDTDLDD